MPAYEYFCKKCEIEFEELLVQQDEIHKYSEWHPCPGCHDRANRIISSTNFTFKIPGGQTQGSGVHGQSGVHDLDYPTVDKAVGRSASKKWEYYNARKAARDKVRRELGTNAVKQIDDTITAVDSKTAKLREQGLKTLRKAKVQNQRPKPGT
jgi:putative FmdB family regulatory protein